jgi:hypothetical protein
VRKESKTAPKFVAERRVARDNGRQTNSYANCGYRIRSLPGGVRGGVLGSPCQRGESCKQQR